MEAPPKDQGAQTLLLEIFSDDVPPKMQSEFRQALQEIISTELKAANILSSDQSGETYSTPLRLAYLCHLKASSGRTIKIKGPKTNSGQQTIDGFMQKYGIASQAQLTTEEGKYIYIATPSQEETGKEIARTIERALHKSARNWEKQMTWTSEGTKWVRPIHSVALMLDNIVLPLTFAGIASTNTTFTSRRKALSLMSQSNTLGEAIQKSQIRISSAGQYLQTLAQNNIMASESTRCRSIISQLENIGKEMGLQNSLADNLAAYQNLVSKNANMCEWPVVAVGKIDSLYQSLPEIILEETMVQNQNYFPLKKNGQLSHFAFVFDDPGHKQTEANQGAQQAEESVKLLANTINGNESVLSARLKDALYFLKADTNRFGSIDASKAEGVEAAKTELGSMLSGNKEMTTLLHRCQDINDLFISLLNRQQLTEESEKKTASEIRRSPELLLFTKLDLRTKVVNELTDLQGRIGAYYWQNWWGHSVDKTLYQTIANIILHQYGSDSKNVFARCYAVANQMEHILFHLSQNKSFSSSADPFGVQRAAMSIVLNTMPLNENFYKETTTKALSLPLSADIIAKMLPAKYKSLANACEAVFTKAIIKSLTHSTNGQAIVRNQANQNISMDTIGLWAEIISTNAFQISPGEIATIEDLFSRATGLAGLNKQQSEILISLKSTNKTTKEALQILAGKPGQAQSAGTKHGITQKTINEIYKELESAGHESEEMKKSSNELWAIANPMVSLAEQKGLFVEEYIHKQGDSTELCRQIRGIKDSVQKAISVTSAKLATFLENNIINTTEHAQSMITRKRAILSIRSSLLVLFPWLQQE